MKYEPGQRVIYTKRGESRHYDTEWPATYIKLQPSGRHHIRVDGRKRTSTVHDSNLRASQGDRRDGRAGDDVCDCCLGDGEFVEYDGDSVPCDACNGAGFVARDSEECDLDYIRDCGDPFAASAPGESA